MNLRSAVLNTIGATAFLALISVNANAQASSSVRATSASHVAAEMTKGKLNPSETKPGDKVALKLKDDVKSNGEVVLKKGTTIDGVVRSVKTVEGKGQASGQAQSMMEIDWFAPAVQGRAAQQLSIALQSVNQVNRLYEQRAAEGSDDFGFIGAGSASATPVATRPSGGGGGLLGGAAGAVGATTSVVGGVGSSVGSTVSSTVGAASTTAARTSTQSNASLLSMPSVMAVDQQTAATLESSFGTSSSIQLFRVGHGQLITAGGSKQSVELFSHLSNDTVITSPSRNFEISSGAQMQLLVGVSK